MDRWAGKVAIVTGASVGIGAAISRALVGHGLKVIGCARNIDKLKELEAELKPKGVFRPVQCDVTREEDILAAVEVARTEFNGVHVLVNNAGLAHAGSILETSTEKIRNMMDVNVIALTVCTREAVKLMREKGIDDGHIINICSMSGHRVLPGTAAMYSASKHAVTALTIGIRNELQALGTHIRVSQISPGLVETEFVQRSTNQETADKVYGSLKSLEAQDVADSVLHMLSAPAHCGIHDILMLPTEQSYSGGVMQPQK